MFGLSLYIDAEQRQDDQSKNEQAFSEVKTKKIQFSFFLVARLPGAMKKSSHSCRLLLKVNKRSGERLDIFQRSFVEIIVEFHR